MIGYETRLVIKRDTLLQDWDYKIHLCWDADHIFQGVVQHDLYVPKLERKFSSRDPHTPYMF